MTPDAYDAEQRAAALARYYDLDVVDISYDAELYLELAQSAEGAVLEMAVGTGRLAVPLALAGHEVVGIDNDTAMLERARARWEAARGAIPVGRLRVTEADFLDYRSETRFGLTFMAINTFLLMEDDEARLALLEAMRRHLHDGGVAAAEMTMPDEAELESYDGRLQLEWLRSDPETGDQVTKVMAARYDEEAGTIELTQIYESSAADGGPLTRVVNTDLLHLVKADRLMELAREAGFAQVDLRGDHLATPYGAGSHRAILVARLV